MSSNIYSRTLILRALNNICEFSFSCYFNDLSGFTTLISMFTVFTNISDMTTFHTLDTSIFVLG